MWFNGVFLNEVLLIFPVLLWWTVRQSLAQRLLDLLRTLPLIAAILVHTLAYSLPLYAWLAAGAWTLVANLAQYRLDAHNSPNFSEFVFVVSHISVLHWIFFTLTSSSLLRALATAVNLGAVAYFASVILFSIPLTRAWACYRSNDVSTFVNGYCPQYTGQYHLNPACEHTFSTSEYNPRCDPTEWGKFVPLHDVVDHAGHAAFHVLASTLAWHLTMIPSASEKARVQACIAVARSGWKTD